LQRPGSLGLGLVFQVSATSLNEASQRRKNRHRLAKYYRKGKEVGELVVTGQAAGPTPQQLDPQSAKSFGIAFLHDPDRESRPN